jgi:hypothetical protein
MGPVTEMGVKQMKTGHSLFTNTRNQPRAWLVCDKDGLVILEVGTDNNDDYYPSFVSSWKPENMAVNRG